MGEWIGGWMSGWIGGWIDEERVDGLAIGWLGRQENEWIVGLMGRLVDG